MGIRVIRAFGFFSGVLAFLLAFHPTLGNGYPSDTTLKNLADNTDIEKSSAFEYFVKGRNAYLLSTPKGYKDAISWYNKALEVDEKYAPAYAGLGEIYALSGDWKGQSEECGASYDKSLEYSLKATELAPELSHSHRALAMSYYALGRYEEAEREAKKAIEIDPSDAEAYFVLWKATGKDPDSEYIRKALDLNPELLMARND